MKDPVDTYNNIPIGYSKKTKKFYIDCKIKSDFRRKTFKWMTEVKYWIDKNI
jgi:hypothetical protein